MTPEVSMTPEKLTDELPAPGMRRDLSRWAGTNPSAVAAGSEAQAVFCISDARNDIAALASALSAERTRADTAQARAADVAASLLMMQNSENMALVAAEERVSALTAESGGLRDALMVQTRRANGCVAGCACLDGGVGWGAKGCVCADDCSRMAATFSAPPAGGEKL